MNLKQLAEYLDIPPSLLLDVSQGLSYLPEEPAYQLVELFLVMFGE